MAIFGTIYIVLGVLYMVACIMDGQDVKPLWKKALGKRLEKVSNYFYPIEYVTRTEYLPSQPIYIKEATFDAVKVESRIMIGEGEVYEARKQEEMARQHGYPHLVSRWKTVPFMVEEAKKRCLQELFEQAKQGVTLAVDEESHWPGIIVSGSMYVGVKR